MNTLSNRRYLIAHSTIQSLCLDNNYREQTCAALLDFLWLALRAEVAATIADGNALNRGATDRAELTTKAVGDLKLKVGSAPCAIGAEIGICAGTLIANG